MKYNRGTTERFIIIVVFALVEVVAVWMLFNYFNEQAAYIEYVLRLLSVFLIVHISNTSVHLSTDIPWIILIALSPVFGTATYLMISGNVFLSKTYRNILSEEFKAREYYKQDKDAFLKAKEEFPENIGQFNYLSRGASYPVYHNEGFDYYRNGEEGFPVILEELRKARKFIFMEYFIVDEGVMWSAIQDVLEEKVKEGVDVRVMYDDFGSMFTLNTSFVTNMEKRGIKCVSFNRVNPIINIIVNHRDHRKILVVDGNVAFTGGINLADEYINQKERFGYWKDNVCRIKGNAVWSMTVMFLTNWNALKHEDDDYEQFRPDTEEEIKQGYLSPYGDTPLDTELTGQNVYLNIISQAKKYVYIMTPYLIIDTDMTNALILAAKRGVDVRIITPGIPDKKMIYQITRSNYHTLLDGGVKVYEYTPGFVHGKVFVSDDIVATVGTINLDYRSLYLHFENGIYMYGMPEILDVRDDMRETLMACRVIRKGSIRMHLGQRIVVAFIKLFSSML